MISSIKNQQLNIQTNTTTADKHKHHTAIEDMLIMPLNDDDDDNNSNNIFTIPKIVATSIQSSSAFNNNYIDSQLFNDNIGNNNNDSDIFHTTTNLINPTVINTTTVTTTPITEIINSNPINTNGLITDNNLLNSNNINYKNISNNKEILCQNNLNIITTTAITKTTTTSTNCETKILSQSNINDTQNLIKTDNIININDKNLIKNKQSIIIKPSNMSIIKPLANATATSTITTTINNNSLKVSLPTNDNQSNLNNEILVNLNSTIPINNTKDFIYKNTNDNINEQQPIQHQQSKQQIINKNNNNLFNVISNNINNNNSELKQFNSIPYLNQNIKNENGLILNKNKIIKNYTINNIDNKSALLLNSSSKNINNTNNCLNFYKNATETITTMPVETPEIDQIENNNNSSASSFSYNNISSNNNISQLQKSSQQQTYEPLKLLTTTALQNLTSHNSKFLNNIKISTYNKLPGFNKIDNNNATIIKTITSNSNLINTKNNKNNNNNAESPIKAATTTSNGLKRVGFINLEQNGWNLNFITTTSLIPPITAASALSSQQSTTTAATTTTASQIPIKATTTINNSNNNNIRINNLSNNITENIKSTVSNIINNNSNSFNNSTIVNRSLIEDVHNYSKKSKRFPGECISTTNSSVEEDESDEEDDEDEDVDDDYEADDGGEEEHNVRESDSKFDYRKFLTTTTKNNTNNKKKRFQIMESELEEKTKNDKNTVADGIKKLNDKIKNIIGVEQRNISERHHSDDDDNNYKPRKTQQKDTNLGANGKSNSEENCDVPSLRPEHHARRPMNAFLIFCKRHRAIVRDKYKNVENRQVTKILGEWWENMSPEEKSSYTNLAKEYKDAFLSANPNFKWYKLPAPPLRTLSMRPQNSNESLISEEQLPNMSSSPSKQNESLADETVQTIEDSINVHTKSPTAASKIESGNMGVFKFADEAQMGGLSSLLNGNSSPTSGGNNSPDLIKFRKLNVDPNVDNEDLQSALGETSQYISLAIPKTESDLQPLEKMYNHAKKMSMSLKSNKRKNTEQDDSVACKKFIRDNSFSSGEEDNWLRKPTRSCKGKKYQELISSGQIATSSKKIKKSNLNLNFAQSNFTKFNSNKESSSDSDGTTVTRTGSNNCNSSSSPLKYELKCTTKDNLLTTKNNNDIKGSEQSDDHQMMGNPDDSSGKPFDTNAFDLETKIMALPAQDLEEYLQKKQESKSKKKIATKRRKNFSIKKSKSNNSTNASSTSPLSEKSSQKILNNQQKDNVQQNKQQKKQHQQESFKEQIVGSQKRKARKESITRRDLSVIYKTTTAVINDSGNPSVNWVDLNVDLKTIENKIEPDLNKSEITGSDDKTVSDNTIREQSIIQQQSHHQSINQISNNPVYNISSQPPVTSNTDLLILAEVASNFDE